MHDLRQPLDDLARELDLLVFRLERPPADEQALWRERRELHRELERLRDQLAELSLRMD